MINGVSNNTYTSATTSNVSTASKAEQAETKADDTAAVYEKSTDTTTKSSRTKAENDAIVSKLKADSDARLASLQNLVQKLFTQQGKTFAWANSDLMNDSSFWNAIRTGNFTVDEATAAQAQADIAEDGYWGVAQTSDRLVDFAKALTGGDASKIEEMRGAIEKGFKEAEKLWGGKLPSISQQTYDATMEKLNKWAEEAGVSTTK